MATWWEQDPNNKYLEFTISVSSNEIGTYFDNALLRIAYNPVIFGNNVVAASNILVTSIGSFNSQTYLDPNSYTIDHSSNVLGISFGTEYSQSAWNRVLLTSSPTPMLKIMLKIINCNNANIDFTDISFTPAFSFYATTANANIIDVENYSNTNYTGNIYDNPCVPIINSFNDHVSAGTGDILTIQGNYFGDKMRDFSTVVFYDANRGFAYPDPLGPKKGGIQHYDVLNWSDNQIDIRLPSKIDSISATPNTPSSFIAAVPGSGKFKVRNFADNEAEIPSTLTLNIDYAVNQYIVREPSFPPGYQYAKTSYQLASSLPSGNYVIHCSPSVETTYPGAKGVIERAMLDWSCLTNINWTMGNDTSVGAYSDDLCIIELTNNIPQAMEASISTRYCGDANYSISPYILSFDILINTDYLWQIDFQNANLNSGMGDFYSVISHELGHGHGLMHINKINDIMFWQDNLGPKDKTLRTRLWYSAGASAAGVWVANNTSSVLCSQSQLHSHQFATPNSNDCIGVSIDEESTSPKIKVYPNPTNSQYVYIDFNLGDSQEIGFALYDISGKALKKTDTLINVGNITEVLYIGDLPTGIYLLQINIRDRESHHVKLIVNN